MWSARKTFIVGSFAAGIVAGTCLIFSATEPESSQPDQANDREPSPLNINQATADEFTVLPGIGPTTAQRIADYRQQHGTFQSLDELTDVTGIGDHTFSRIQSMITL
ncbi:MAG: ComEA family DNA-binding protein [bacterium]